MKLPPPKHRHLPAASSTVNAAFLHETLSFWKSSQKGVLALPTLSG